MFAPTRFLIIAMILMPACAGRAAREGSSDTATRPCPLVIGLLQPERSFIEGQPIPITVRFINTSSESIGWVLVAPGSEGAVTTGSRHALHSLTMEVEPYPHADESYKLPECSLRQTFIDFGPYACEEMKMNLLEFLKLPSGAYQVYFDYSRYGVGPRKEGNLDTQSNTIRLKILPAGSNEPGKTTP